jgi:transcriptional regulator with XRE-family HTH domain
MERIAVSVIASAEKAPNVYQYERGQLTPSEEALNGMEHLLDVPIDAFYEVEDARA